jgi:hypothetical protein
MSLMIEYLNNHAILAEFGPTSLGQQGPPRRGLYPAAAYTSRDSLVVEEEEGEEEGEGEEGRRAVAAAASDARSREKRIRGSGGSLEPPGPLLTHLHTVYVAYSEGLPTRLSPLAERTCFSFPLLPLLFSYYAEGCMASCMRDRIIRYFPLAERACSPFLFLI